MISPLSRVLTAVEEGASSRAEVAERTGLDRDLADTAIDHLVRIGRLQATALGITCPAGRCGSCDTGNDGAPGCDSGRSVRTPAGPALLQISIVRPAS